jgi:hypothetical protein
MKGEFREGHSLRGKVLKSKARRGAFSVFTKLTNHSVQEVAS